MKNLVFILIGGLLIQLNAKAQEINWQNWNDAYQIAQNENKTMLVFVQADWCHWCKRMNDKTFNKTEVSEIVNENFIAVKFDIEKEVDYNFKGKMYKGKELLGILTNNELKGIPSTVFVSVKTEKIKLEPGFISADDMKLSLEKYKQNF